MLMIGVIAAVIGIVIVLLIPWFPANGARQAGNIRTLYDVLLIVSVPMFVLVLTVVGYSVWKFRSTRMGRRFTATPGSRSCGRRFRRS
jgi:cytochrome c oxidase subunit 2